MSFSRRPSHSRSSGYTLQQAKGINDNGQIIAYAQLERDPGHPVHAVLLTPN